MGSLFFIFMKSYKTIENENSDEFIVKKSKFIGYAKPVSTQEEAVAFINEIKSKHWDATHNVYAYIIADDQLQRYSDDGEPQGTAGIPVLDVLQKEGLTNLVVVATRYFGGIMLGAGGLVRAYSHTAKIAVDAGGIITMSECSVCKIVTDYTFYGRLVPLLCSHGANVTDTDFGVDVTVDFTIPMDCFDKLNSEIFDLSNGKYKAEELTTEFLKI